ncbi:histone-like nucleoid-structuring protein Lsr2 [Nocardiopsis sp. YSL2]|uniref:Lsr2 family DNA-binding protein n=1 Tax=Nocardiopsis sp. YSL2 TaxID=2939492 RepID=UPI0026F468A6|nr:histone-like nucleoid-structuring protein Lsr2 [Nocardiopsis sp. YSL2]
MPDLLVARTSAVVAIGRRRVRIRKGVTIVNADDSFVRGRENLFEPLEVPYIGGGDASKRRRPVVEETTADPGQTREPDLTVSSEDPQETSEGDGQDDRAQDDAGQEAPAAGDVGPEPEAEPSTDGAPAAEPTAKEVRAWCKDKNIDVPPRGRIPDDVMAAYRRAHGGGW